MRHAGRVFKILGLQTNMHVWVKLH